MNTDKILGYVEAMIDDYICKLEGANDPMRRHNLSIVIENLRSLKEFTEVVTQEGQVQEQLIQSNHKPLHSLEITNSRIKLDYFILKGIKEYELKSTSTGTTELILKLNVKNSNVY